MPEIRLQHLRKDYGAVNVIEDLNLEMADGDGRAALARRAARLGVSAVLRWRSYWGGRNRTRNGEDRGG